MVYERPPKSAAEIACLPPPGTTERGAHLRACLTEFSPETLVFLIREAEKRKDTSTFELCCRALIQGEELPSGRWRGGHCEKVLFNVARRGGFHLDRDVLKEFRALCHYALLIAVRDHGPAQRLLEERFGLAFRRKCLDQAKQLYRQLKWEASHVSKLEEHLTSRRLSSEDASREVAGQELLEAAILGLPGRQREVAFMVIQKGWPVESTLGPSVASILQLTPRRVRQVLRAARGSLMGNAAIRAYLEGR